MPRARAVKPTEIASTLTRAASSPGQVQQSLMDPVPSAAGFPHDRLAETNHSSQNDQGVEIAQRLVTFFSATTAP
ncbi:MAG: hypothetical protein AAGF11_24275 [Myxococcota bacterium]